ncbi:MAG: HEXXH motif domain-containing protein [Actinoplanes sp.]
MTPVHQLTPTLFEAVATGEGGPEAIARLRAAQVSKHLLLIRFLLDRWADAPEGVRDLLERSRAADPQGFASVAGAPLVGGWAAIAARAAMQDRAAPADFAHLAAIAVVAGAVTGVDGSALIPVHDGLAVLPGWGAIEAGDAPSIEVMTTGGRIVAVVGGAAFEVPSPRENSAAPPESVPFSPGPGPESGQPGWLPVRRLVGDSAGRVIRLGLDDVHPYRHGHHVPPANRLADDEVERWRGVFADSWALLAEHLPGRADELAAGLTTLVPLVQTDPRSARSATIRHAFGVFGLTRPGTPADFATTLVHEFQHSKLSAVLDLVPLTDPADTGRYFAPWRTDPRPLAGLLQGVYAFVGVADTWRALRGAVGVAEARFAEARLQVDRGLTAVQESGALTREGELLATALRRTTDAMLAEAVPAPVAQAAEARLAQTRQTWRDRNQV